MISVAYQHLPRLAIPLGGAPSNDHHDTVLVPLRSSGTTTSTSMISRDNERFHVVSYARTVFRKIFYRAFVF